MRLQPVRGFLWGSILLVAIGVGLFQDVLRLGFISDDLWLTAAARNEPFPIVDQWWKGVEHIPGVDRPPSPYYRPLVILSFYLNDLLSHNNPVGFHLFNFGLHLLNTVLLFYCLCFIRQLVGHRHQNSTRFRSLEFLLSLVFLLHPASTHNAAWISGRTDLLAGFFSLLAVIAYIRTRGELWSPKKVWATVFFVLGLMAKEIALLLPLAIVWLEIMISRFEEGRIRLRAIVEKMRWHLVGFSLVLFSYALLRMFVVGSPLAYIYSYQDYADALRQIARGYSTLILPVDSMTAFRIYLAHPHVVLTAAVLGVLVLISILLLSFREILIGSVKRLILLIVGVFFLMLFWFPQGGIAQRTVYPLVAWVLLSLEVSIATIAKELLNKFSKEAAAARRRYGLAMIALLAGLFTWSSQWILNDYKHAAKIKGSALASLLDLSAIESVKGVTILLVFPHAVRHSMIFGNVDEDLQFAQTMQFDRLLSFYQGIALVGQDYQSLEAPLSIIRHSKNEFIVRAMQEGQSLLLREAYYRRAKEGDTMERALGKLEVIDVHSYGRASAIRITVHPKLIDANTTFYAYSSGHFIAIQ